MARKRKIRGWHDDAPLPDDVPYDEKRGMMGISASWTVMAAGRFHCNNSSGARAIFKALEQGTTKTHAQR